MNSKTFLKLLDRYQKKKITGTQKKMMDIWYDSIDYSDANRHHLNEEEAGKVMWRAISQGMNEDTTKGQVIPVSFWKRHFTTSLAAACLLFVIGFIGYYYLSSETPMIAGVKNEVVETMNRVTNETAAKKAFNLPDGSRITLEPGATLFYPSTFTKQERRVYLKGDVFFEIAHDSARPFYVHANNIVTKVLGTSFTIKENKAKNSIEVAVLTGVVEVKQQMDEDAIQKAEQKVVLTQNKKVTYYQRDEKLITGIIEQPKIIQSKVASLATKKFNYVEKPLAEIVPVLEEAYGVRILLGNEKLRDCVITADLSQENTLFTQLEILCESIDATYQLTNDSITLSGKGCDLVR